MATGISPQEMLSYLTTKIICYKSRLLFFSFYFKADNTVNVALYSAEGELQKTKIATSFFLLVVIYVLGIWFRQCYRFLQE